LEIDSEENYRSSRVSEVFWWKTFATNQLGDQLLRIALSQALKPALMRFGSSSKLIRKRKGFYFLFQCILFAETKSLFRELTLFFLIIAVTQKSGYS